MLWLWVLGLVVMFFVGYARGGMYTVWERKYHKIAREMAQREDMVRDIYTDYTTGQAIMLRRIRKLYEEEG